MRVRPGRGTRPRSRLRPDHDDAVSALVTAVDRGRWTCQVGGDAAAPPVVAMRARELGRTPVVVGDRVGLVGDTSGAEGSLARIVRVEDRTSALRRTADDTDPHERLLVANADLLAVVTAVADPEPRTRMIDRCLVAAYDGGLAPVLVLTKTDLADPAPLLAAYEPLGVSRVALRHDDEAGVAHLQSLLAGRTTVLVGHSGVGKSTLVNRLVPGSARAIGAVNAVTGRGRHTSSSAVALPLAAGGWVVDTPGVRSFGLAHVEPATVIAAFPELAAGTEACPRACPHTDPQTCAVDAWVATGHAGPGGPARLDSLRRLLAGLTGPDGPAGSEGTAGDDQTSTAPPDRQ